MYRSWSCPSLNGCSVPIFWSLPLAEHQQAAMPWLLVQPQIISCTYSHQMSIQIQKGLQPNLKRWPVNVCAAHSPFIYMNVNVVMQLTLATGSEMGNDEKLILYPQVHISFALCHLAWEKKLHEKIYAKNAVKENFKVGGSHCLSCCNLTKEYGSVELISSVTSDVLHKQQEFSSVAATKSVHKNMFLSEILPLLLQMH